MHLLRRCLNEGSKRQFCEASFHMACCFCGTSFYMAWCLGAQASNKDEFCFNWLWFDYLFSEPHECPYTLVLFLQARRLKRSVSFLSNWGKSIVRRYITKRRRKNIFFQIHLSFLLQIRNFKEL